MVLGASPSAPEYHKEPDVDAVASAGDAILLRRPGFYFINEQGALWKHANKLSEARQLGTQVILADHLYQVIRQRKGPAYSYPCDMFLKLYPISCYKSWRIWVLGLYVPMCGGGMALQWAINHGATEVHMVGMEGYTGGADYFAGQAGTDDGPAYNKQVYVPFLQRVISQRPQVQFTVYGNPSYELQGDNVTLIGNNQGDQSSAPTLSRGSPLERSVQ